MTILSKLIELAEKEAQNEGLEFDSQGRGQCRTFVEGYLSACRFWKHYIEDRDAEIERLRGERFMMSENSIKWQQRHDRLKSKLQMAKDGLREIIDNSHLPDELLNAVYKGIEIMKKLESE